MNMKIEQITAAYPNVAKLESQAGRELLAAVVGQLSALAAENAGLKSKLMFWDVDNPEVNYSSPEEIANDCGLNYGDEFEVQVAATLPNRTYRVCESWDQQCKLELVEGAEVDIPATDAFLAEVRAQGVSLFANTMRETGDDITGEADPERGALDGALTVALLVAIQQVNDMGKENSVQKTNSGVN
jgi:hypothetical protein